MDEFFEIMQNAMNEQEIQADVKDYLHLSDKAEQIIAKENLKPYETPYHLYLRLYHKGAFID